MTKKEFNNIKGIIFDLDGTLYHRKWFMRPMMTFWALPEPLLLPVYMRIRKEFVDKDMGTGENLLRTIARMMGNEKKMYNWLTKKFYNCFLNTLKFMKNSRPGINETLSSLKDSGIKIAVLSDYSKIEERLKILNIDTSFIDMMISSETEGYLKPGVGPFNKVKDSFDLNPQNILVVGDRDDTDGIAAERCNMQFLKITDKNEGDGLPWQEVKTILENLSNK